MPRVIRTATIQARVLPTIKEASERVLWRIGLNMSEAVELFLRRIITDEKLPFDVVAVAPGRLGVSDKAQAGTELGILASRRGESGRLRRKRDTAPPRK